MGLVELIEDSRNGDWRGWHRVGGEASVGSGHRDQTVGQFARLGRGVEVVEQGEPAGQAPVVGKVAAVEIPHGHGTDLRVRLGGDEPVHLAVVDGLSGHSQVVDQTGPRLIRTEVVGLTQPTELVESTARRPWPGCR